VNNYSERNISEFAGYIFFRYYQSRRNRRYHLSPDFVLFTI